MCLAARINTTLPRAWQEDEEREDDFSRAMVATDDLACAHPASGQASHHILTALQHGRTRLQKPCGCWQHGVKHVQLCITVCTCLQ